MSSHQLGYSMKASVRDALRHTAGGFLCLVACVALLTGGLAAPAVRIGAQEVSPDSAPARESSGRFTSSGLWYSVRGAGPAIVLIHGSNLDSRVMRPLADSLAANHTVVLTDLRFHGRSRDDGRPFAFAQDLVDVMNDAGVRHGILLGHSLGAEVALTVARLYPTRVEGLVLLSPSVGGVPITRPIEGLAAVIAAVRAGEMRRAGEALAMSAPMRLLRDTTSAETLRRIIAANVALFTVDPTRAIAAAPMLGHLRELPAIPILAVVGDADPTNAADAADSLRAAIPSAIVVRLPGCGHILPLDCLGTLASAIRRNPPLGARADRVRQ